MPAMNSQLLMIEDDHRLAQMVGEYLGQSGLQVMHRADGASGLARLQGSELRLRFRGKSGVQQETTLNDPQVARVVRRCQQLPIARNGVLLACHGQWSVVKAGCQRLTGRMVVVTNARA